MIYKENLKNERIKKNLLQKDLAKIIGVVEARYCYYENETEIIPIKHLNTISNFLNISFDYVFNLNKTLNYNNYKKEIDKTIAGQRLKEFRKENNFTLEKLGRVLNISYGTLAGYERGRYSIATPFLYTICSKYHISADYLLGKIDSPKYLK